jgi:hypothetical protein
METAIAVILSVSPRHFAADASSYLDPVPYEKVFYQYRKLENCWGGWYFYQTRVERL